MIDLLPWFLLLLVLALTVGYFAGRRSRTQPIASWPASVSERPIALSAGASAGVRAHSPAAASAESDCNARAMPGSQQPQHSTPRPGAVQSDSSSGAGQRNIVALASARSWGYQLQNLNLKRAEASPYDLLVIDYAKDGSDDSALTPAEVERLKCKPDGSRRIIVAYVSIGEAESYRSYWRQDWKRNKPSWLLGENPEWEGNYSVCFWEPEWQQLICGSPGSYIDQIIGQGFDGIYLDKCDVTDDLRKHFKQVARGRPGMEADMVAFVRRISAYAKAKRPGFQIILQNAEALLEQAELRHAIDAVAKEELFFGLDRPEKPNARDEITGSRDLLDLLKRDGKPVFVVEYLDSQPRIAEAVERIRSLGYVLYVAPKNRELDCLTDFKFEA